MNLEINSMQSHDGDKALPSSLIDDVCVFGVKI